MALLDDLDYRRETALRHRENSARLAQAYARFSTTGQGTFEYAERVSFGLTFIEEPIIAYGCYCNLEDLTDLQGRQVDDPVLPNCTGFVTEWDRNERDLYIGAWIATRVHFPMEDFPEEVHDLTAYDPGTNTVTPFPLPHVNERMNQAVVKHHFTFSGIAMKDVPVDLAD